MRRGGVKEWGECGGPGAIMCIRALLESSKAVSGGKRRGERSAAERGSRRKRKEIGEPSYLGQNHKIGRTEQPRNPRKGGGGSLANAGPSLSKLQREKREWARHRGNNGKRRKKDEKTKAGRF